MLNPPPCTDQNLHRILRLDVRLSRAGTESGWTGEVSVPGHDARLRFPSLPALIAWIARLEPPPPPRGIR